MTDTATGDAATHDDHEHRSRWPLVAAVGAAALYFGVGLYLLGDATGVVPPLAGAGLAIVGLVGVVAGLLGWVAEVYVRHRTTGDRKQAYRLTMGLFLATDLGTFGAAFVYYFFVRAGPWPPAELPELVGSLVLVNTAILLVSSGTLHAAHVALERERKRWFLGLLGLTTALGVVFLGGQALEYYEFVAGEGFTLSSGVYWSAFYGLTGLHGLHVALGVLFMGAVLVRGLRGRYSADRDTAVSTLSLYWHFVDAVWVFLVLVLYVGASLAL